MGNRQTWPQIRQNEAYRGRWVALDQCQYDSRSGQPVGGSVVDSDEDLAELCGRLQECNNRHCAIMFCDDVPESEPLSSRPTPTPLPRPYTH
jgi:hypothetical protein